jgi:acyl-CoA synthetase (AMP-forming)/AMP-acid ligase II
VARRRLWRCADADRNYPETCRKIPGLKLVNAYGSTETSSPSTIMPPQFTASHSDSVGLPCPGAHIIAVDPAGRELPRGDIGEIWIHGGSVIKGYWNNPRATAESFTAGYWHSGDLGSIDEQNFVRVFDRQKDMINRGGLKIYSAEVESVLAGHPAVVESAIIARACPVLGERVHAVVVVRSDIDLPALRAVRRAHVGLQSTGDHRHRHRAAAAQRQWQGDEEKPARQPDGRVIGAAQASLTGI